MKGEENEKIIGYQKKNKKCQGLTELEGQEPVAREEDIDKHSRRSLTAFRRSTVVMEEVMGMELVKKL